MLSLGKPAGLEKVPLPGQPCVAAGHWEDGGRWSPTRAPWIRGGGSSWLGRGWLGLGCVGGGGVAADGGTGYGAG